jgi:hypothetical protein
MPDRPGDTFPLLLYRQVMRRFRQPMLLVALLLAGLWLLVISGQPAWPPATAAGWLQAGAAAAGFAYLFSLVGARLAYVQPRADHLRLQTPIYRLKISYRRIVSTRPVNLGKTFPASTLNRAEARMLQPFMAQPALGLELSELPLRPFLLKLFFHRLFLAPDRPGLILIVDDWMRLSEQLSDHIDTRRSQRSDSEGRHFSTVARILSEPDE